MGCDIHPWIQYRKSPERSWWNFSGEMNWDRWYVLFELMAGVRCYAENECAEGECKRRIEAPRGWPEDSCNLPEESDLHTPSWLTLDELREVQKRMGDRGNKPADLNATIAAMTQLEADGMETRLVFAFDN